MVEVEIETLAEVFLLDVDDLISNTGFEDHLLEEQESPLVINFLSDLNLRVPEMWRVCFLAITTLKVLDDEIDRECLLQQRAGQDFLLDSNLDLESFGMSLCPDEVGVDEFDAL